MYPTLLANRDDFLNLYATLSELFFVYFREPFMHAALRHNLIYSHERSRGKYSAGNIKLATDYFARYTCEKCDTSSTRYQGTSSRKIRVAN